MEDVKIKEWIKDNHKYDGTGHGYGYGYGIGYGISYGIGYGISTGDGYGDDYGDGTGRGTDGTTGTGFSDGTGYGFDNGYITGTGYGYGDGTGYGHGYDDGVKMFGNNIVYMIDDIQTIIKQIKGQVAKGFILNKDFTLEPCYVAKGNGFFAHGRTIRESQDSLRKKIFDNMDSDEAIEEFIKKFDKNKTYKGTEFFEWHHYLTGSCLTGRTSFVKNNGINLDSEYTVLEFIKICENTYGSEVIKKLKAKWLLL